LKTNGSSGVEQTNSNPTSTSLQAWIDLMGRSRL